jgi:hypothetical protein
MGRSLQEKCSGLSGENGSAEVSRIGGLASVEERMQPPASHRFEYPEAKVVGKPNLWKAQSFREVVECEEIDEG